ncbi:p21-C-terminal region-binding protein-domain-containing protein [Obelidium mucronatum]|nr:p21-C-terminal region-binding protein-domain-containing protein [Obelidium mucronatum]
MKRKQEHESEDGGSDKEDNEKDQSDNEDRDGDDGSDKEEVCNFKLQSAWLTSIPLACSCSCPRKKPTQELIDVDFDFFDPKEIDFHGLKSLFKQTVVKVDDSQDPYAVTTVLNLVAETNKKLPEPIATLKSYILSKSKKYNKENHDLFESILDSKSSGLLVNERLINMPPQIVVPMLKMLDEELEWSVEEKKEKPFEYLVYISKTYQEVEPVVNEDDDADAEGSGSKKKKKKASSSFEKGSLELSCGR